MPATLADLPERAIDATGLTQDEAEHRRQSLDLWRATMSNLSLPPAPGWVGVVSWLTDEVAFMQLPEAVEPSAYLDDSPFLLPAARLLDDFEAYAVVYADHERATLYLAALGKLEEEERLRGDVKNHVRKGGWSQQRYERRRDREIHRYCQALIDRLKALIEQEGLRRIVLAGDKILLNELEKRMAPDMVRMVVCRLPMEARKDPREIFRETLSAAEEEERRQERWLRDAIAGEHAAGGRAVVGPVDTLAALREKRVRWLLVGPMDDVDFWRCSSCGEAALGEAAECRSCGAATYPQSAANEFLDLAFAGSSRVELASDDLNDPAGVGALLRW
jgi:peptide chain release factor subunit 1